MPRIAFVPLITMFFGLGIASKVVTSWFVVFFLVFFNTYKGGRSVERELIDFCRTLGGTPRQVNRQSPVLCRRYLCTPAGEVKRDEVAIIRPVFGQ